MPVPEDKIIVNVLHQPQDVKEAIREKLPLSVFKELANTETYQIQLKFLADGHIFADWFRRGVKDAGICLNKIRLGQIWTGRDTYGRGGTVAISRRDFETLKIALTHPIYDDDEDAPKREDRNIPPLDLDL
ncbi:MAG: hypothetical protein HY280_08805 [Nitrospinae bacterium]|nr:hypothetical protein [Nitrospinota bacterium]